MLVNVSRQAKGNKCWTSHLANFLDVFQLIVLILNHNFTTHRFELLDIWQLNTYVSAQVVIAVDTDMNVVTFLKIWCLRDGVCLHHVNAFVFGNIPNFVEACESS